MIVSPITGLTYFAEKMRSSIIIILGMLFPSLSFAQTDSQRANALQWIQSALEGYFTDSLSMEQITTKRYAQFKTDMINVEFDGGKSITDIEKEWGNVYDTKDPDQQQAFLIPLQDWNQVKVNCQLLSGGNTHEIWILAAMKEVTISEPFIRYLKLVKQRNSFKIDDVRKAFNGK